MRRVIYQVLLRAPVKVAGASSGVIGFVSSVWPDRVKAVIGAGIPVQPIGIALLTAAVIYFVLLWLLKPGESKDGGAATGQQTTLAPHSHNVHAGRDVHIHPTPAATQPVKSPYGTARSPRDDPNFSLLNPAPPQQEYPLAGRRQEYPLSAHQGPKPDMELCEVVGRVSDSLDGPPELISDFEKRVERKIKDGVHHWRLHTWGRKNDPNAGLDVVWGDAWLKGHLNHAKGWLRFKHPDNPRYVHEWTDLHFNRAEVDKWLPPNLGPHGWMAR